MLVKENSSFGAVGRGGIILPWLLLVIIEASGIGAGLCFRLC